MDMGKKDMLERAAKVARRVYMKGFAAGNGGNVSIRVRGQVHISPSGGCLGDLTAEDMIMLEMDGFVPSAGGSDYEGRRPSKEVRMYLAYYGNRPDILCLFHLHSPYSIVVTCHRQEDKDPAMGMPTYTPGYTIRVGKIPMISCYRPGSRGLAEAVSRVIYRRDSLLLANHGMVATDKGPGVVLAVTEEIEENAHLAILLRDRGIPLDEGQIEALFQTGGKV